MQVGWASHQTSTATKPDVDAVALHIIVVSLTYSACTTVALNRQHSALGLFAMAAKPLPNTVTGVPPSTTPLAGDMKETAAATVYAKLRRDCEYCWPLMDTSTCLGVAVLDGGAMHSIWLLLMWRAVLTISKALVPKPLPPPLLSEVPRNGVPDAISRMTSPLPLELALAVELLTSVLAAAVVLRPRRAVPL